MKTKTINAQNWSGETVTFAYDETSIEMYGYEFTIERLPEVPGIPEFEHYQVTDESGISFGVTRWGKKPFMAVEGSVVREGNDLHEVIAAMIANLY